MYFLPSPPLSNYSIYNHRAFSCTRLVYVAVGMVVHDTCSTVVINILYGNANLGSDRQMYSKIGMTPAYYQVEVSYCSVPNVSILTSLACQQYHRLQTKTTPWASLWTLVVSSAIVQKRKIPKYHIKTI